MHEDRPTGRGQLQHRIDELTTALETVRHALADSERRLSLAMGEVERAHAAKSHFLSRMSHDVRTPLNAMLGFAHLLQSDDLTSQQHESVHQILEAGGQLLGLMNEVLDFASVESGHLSLSLQPVAVDEVIRRIVAAMRPLAVRHEITISVTGQETPVHVRADPQRLLQILMNLLSNAIKYNQPAGRVDVTSEVVDEERVRIVVADTGPGIDDARIERLFVPFERLDMDRGTIEGTGLGLALSRSLAEAMDGTIGVRSEPGSGSSFWLELKRSLPPKRAGTVAAGVAEGRVRPGAGTILYIEDNPSNLRLVQRVLAQRRPGLALLSAMDGKSGIAMAQERQPDLIFLDLNLPDKPGEEVLRRLWADQQTREIPVIVLSADATRSTSQRLIAAGARAYLTKPIDVPRLIALVDERFCQ